MTKRLLLISLVGLLTITAVTYLSTEKKEPPLSSISQKIIPNVSFQTLDGQMLALHDFKNKIILLNFWASWCAPCLVEFPDLIKLAYQNKNKVTLIALSVDDDIEQAQKFIQKMKQQIDTQHSWENIVIAHDPDKKIAHDNFQSFLYPETYIISPDLKIAKKIVGVTDWLSDDMQTYLSAIATSQAYSATASRAK